ncbi:transglycosylase SLT domain-containing protein [Bradyrhizobium canariense]|uniref:Transglycosylase SLT domain-containing protein n=1 Tax=Bradyrhizobium canariense TaxID=255045 RepID=A0A1H1W2E4_9BRAD|nr:transglycosylase SLT domain-containing protein [Bradyrhizobium canariense]SDS90419.1 Transglycosylase SLT domain-containing protein [Bradyrhizobium canariense]
MQRLLSLSCLAILAALLIPGIAQAQQHREYDELVASHARANGVPEALVHRVIVRESRYQPGLVGRGGAIGLMQIKLATARSLGYTGDAAGLRDPNTNLTYAVKYLAGAYRAANGDHNRAVHYYAAGYYYAAKRQRLDHRKHPEPLLAGAPLQLVDPADANAEQVPALQEGANDANAR